LPAYLAFCNGFYTSGQGSELNESLHLMSKWRKYIKRTEHGPRTRENLTKDFAKSIKSIVTGQGKDPVSVLVQRRAMSTPLGTMQEEGVKFHAQLKVATSTLGEAMSQRLDELGSRQVTSKQETQERLTLLVRRATLELMNEVGVKSFRPSKEAIRDKVSEHNGRHALLDTVIDRELGKLLVFTSQEVGARRTWHMDSKKLRFKHLEHYAQELFDPPQEMVRGILTHLRAQSQALSALECRTPQQERALGYANIMLEIGKARQIADGGRVETKDRLDRFQLMDLVRLARKQPVREGTTEQTTYDVLEEIGHTNTDITTASSGQTAGVDLGAFVASVQKSLLLPIIVRPIAKLTRSDKAVVQVGDAAAGAEFVVGNKKSIHAGLGGRVTLGAKFAENRAQLNVTAGLEGRASRITKHRSVVISSPIDVQGGEDTPQDKKGYMDYGHDIAKFIRSISEGPELSKAQIMERYADWFGDDRRVGFSLRDHRSSTGAMALHLGANARAGAVSGLQIGPSLGLDLIGSIESRHAENAGRFQNRMRDSQTKVNVRAVASISSKAGQFIKGDKADVGLTGQPLVGIWLELNPAGTRTLTRIVNDENGLRPGMTYRTRYFPDAHSMTRYLNDRVDKCHQWYHDLTMTSYDGRPLQGKDVVKQFMREATAEGRSGNIRFEERVQLKQWPAEEINLIQDEIDDLLSHGCGFEQSKVALTSLLADQIRHLESEKTRIYKLEENWSVRWLRVVQTEYKGHTAGLNFLPVLTDDREVQAPHKRVGVKGTLAYTKETVAYTGTSDAFRRDLEQQIADKLEAYQIDVDIDDAASFVTADDELKPHAFSVNQNSPPPSAAQRHVHWADPVTSDVSSQSLDMEDDFADLRIDEPPEVVEAEPEFYDALDYPFVSRP
jgi:hypothetical protein